MSTSPATTATALARLSVGERAWFWLCPSSNPPLLVTSLTNDPGMEALEAAIDEVDIPVGGEVTRGLLQVTASGSLRFGAPNLGREGLVALADWVWEHRWIHRPLDRLKGASFVDLQSDGTVRAVHELPVLWADLPDPPVPGTPAGAARALEALEVGEDAWFWATAESAAGEPALVVVSTRTDPEAAQLLHLIGVLHGEGVEVHGVLRLTEENRIAVTSRSDVDTLDQVLRAVVVAHPRLEPLRDARLLQLTGDGVRQAKTLDPGPDPVTQAEMIAVVRSGSQSVRFWFTDADRDGRPALLLDTDQEALKHQISRIGGSGRIAHGMVTRRDSGWVLFASRKSFPDFLPVLADWTRAHVPACPALAELAGSREVVLDSQGAVLERHKNDELWRFLDG